MKKFLTGAIAAMLLLSPLSANAQGIVRPGQPGFTLPAACLPAAIVQAGSAAACLALFLPLTRAEAAALRASVAAANGGNDVALLVQALQSAGLAAGADASAL